MCLKTARVLRRDWTVAHQGHRYQIHDPIRASRVKVEERLDGTLRITHQRRTLAYHVMTAQPQTSKRAGPAVPVPRRAVSPRPDHPWRKRLLPDRRSPAAAATT